MTRTKELLLALGIGAAIALTAYSGITYWFDRHSVRLQNPIVIESIETKKVIIRKVSPTPTFKPSPTPTKRPTKPSKVESGIHILPQVHAEERVESYTPSDQEIIDYIRSKDWDGDIAVALAKSENFWNLTHSFDCGREGKMNSNGTVDHGLWQINDIHITAGKISLADTLDCKKATDFAYGLYVGRGNTFTAWSAFNNGSYKNHL